MSQAGTNVTCVPQTAASFDIPELRGQNTPSSSVSHHALFGVRGPHSAIRSHPSPPVGPPPASTSGAADYSNLVPRGVIDIKLPGVSSRKGEHGLRAAEFDDRKFLITRGFDSNAAREKVNEARKVESEERTKACRRIDEITGQPAQSQVLLSAVAEAEGLTAADEELFSAKSVKNSSEHADVSQCDDKQKYLSTETKDDISHKAPTRMIISKVIETHVRDEEHKNEICKILAKMEACTHARRQAEADWRTHQVLCNVAEESAQGQAKHKRAAEIRSLAKDIARGSKEGAGDGAGSEREEIERALAAVDETRRKRMERQNTGHEVSRRDNDKFRRRQIKKEELLKKRRDMEERLDEEANKMAQLTENAKKKGESKFMTEEAKRDAEERIQADTKVVAQLERQAAEMAAKRENMLRQIKEEEDEKVSKIKASASLLKAKRAQLEACMRQEEIELKTLSEETKCEMESKMAEEAAAIAEMEQQASQLSAKRAELEVQMVKRLRLEKTLVKESKSFAEKKEALETKMREEEEHLQKMSDDAKRRVMEKMAIEAAAIADMEQQANELAIERATLATQIAVQRASVFPTSYFIAAQPSQNCIGDNPGVIQAGALQREVPGEKDEYPYSDIHIPTESPDEEAVVSASANVIESIGTPTDTSGIVVGENMEHKSHVLRFMPNEVQHNEPIPCETQDFAWAFRAEPVAKDEEQFLEEQLDNGQLLQPKICAQCNINHTEMSSAHIAAAGGHVHCLEVIKDIHPELTTKLDVAGRSPLFYACAAARADAVSVLIREGPQCCHLMDNNEDTPLHAAALAGSAQSCRILIQQGRVEVDPRNAICMTPAHLAGNTEVLEVLSQHGADLNVKDADLRTPLFMACATDRLEKAEFLCELLECAGQDLGEADKRGDTPVHAAACNGSTACLLLLLQYGVAPDIRNLKGLRAIDLAARKGQSACEKILMEYQLHHQVDNSYFDSVLFLATLEGHKKCKEVLKKDEVSGNTRSPSTTSDLLPRPASLWSLSRGRSVRLKHWGDWIAYEDQDANNVFWYNHVAGTSQWETPSGVRETSLKHMANASMRLKKEGKWIEYTLTDGNVFYYNDETNDFQWRRPDQLSPRVFEKGISDRESRSTTPETIARGTKDWGAFKDPSTGLVFWYHHVTGESRWEPPDDAGPASGMLVEAGDLANEHSIPPFEEQVREVACVDELFSPR